MSSLLFQALEQVRMTSLEETIYQYFKGSGCEEISCLIKKYPKHELADGIFETIMTDSEVGLLCHIFACGLKGVKANTDLIELANQYLLVYPQGDELSLVLSRLAKAYMGEYEIEKVLGVCRLLNDLRYDYLHTIYCEALYKLNRTDEAVRFLKNRLAELHSNEKEDERFVNLMSSIEKNLDKYETYIETGHVYIPSTEKGREKLGITEAFIRSHRPDVLLNSQYVLQQYATKNTFVAFDFETTGFMPHLNEIIEIGAVKVRDGIVIDTFTTLVKPNDHVPASITQLTGITNTMVQGAMHPAKATIKLYQFIEGYPLVGHNVLFDMKFLDYNLALIGKSIQAELYDTLSLAKRYYGGLPSYKLTELSQRLGIEHTDAHRALFDAQTTAKLYLMCYEEEKNQRQIRIAD